MSYPLTLLCTNYKIHIYTIPIFMLITKHNLSSLLSIFLFTLGYLGTE